jgi:Enoyl-CoA hydratase/isomerase
MSGAFSFDEIDFLGADRFSALGDAPVLIVDAASWHSPLNLTHAVCVGIHSEGALPEVDPKHFDVLLTAAPDAPEPWVSVAPGRLVAHVEDLAQTVREWPMAATIMCRVLRLSDGLAIGRALEIESFAYSALLGGSEFDRWRKSCALQPIPASEEPLVLVERDADVVTLTLNHPSAQNAMTAAMRDALYTALANALDDPTAPNVVLQGAGKCFSTGGALGEFGTATDLAQAHVVRTVRSCVALLDRLGSRATVRLHGACVGSGLEVPAAAARRIATQNAWFQLPELRMGLIPGAGGTASVARAIGRHRTAWMLLSGKRIDAGLALAWGLVQGIVG